MIWTYFTHGTARQACMACMACNLKLVVIEELLRGKLAKLMVGSLQMQGSTCFGFCM